MVTLFYNQSQRTEFSPPGQFDWSAEDANGFRRSLVDWVDVYYHDGSPEERYVEILSRLGLPAKGQRTSELLRTFERAQRALGEVALARLNGRVPECDAKDCGEHAEGCEPKADWTLDYTVVVGCFSNHNDNSNSAS